MEHKWLFRKNLSIVAKKWRYFFANKKVMLTINCIANLFKMLKFQFFERNL